MPHIITSTTELQETASSTYTHSYVNPSGGDLLLFGINFRENVVINSVTYGGVTAILLEVEDRVSFPMTALYGIPASNQPTEGVAHDLVVNIASSITGSTSFTKVDGVNSNYLADISTIPTTRLLTNSSYISIDITPVTNKNLLLGFITCRDGLELVPDYNQRHFGIFDSPRTGSMQSREYNDTTQTQLTWNSTSTSITVCAIAIPTVELNIKPEGFVYSKGQPVEGAVVTYYQAPTTNVNNVVVGGKTVKQITGATKLSESITDALGKHEYTGEAFDDTQVLIISAYWMEWDATTEKWKKYSKTEIGDLNLDLSAPV